MLKFINNITPHTNHKAIFSRLGYKQKQTEVDEKVRKQVTDWIDEAASLIKLKGVTLECSFEIAIPRSNTTSCHGVGRDIRVAAPRSNTTSCRGVGRDIRVADPRSNATSCHGVGRDIRVADQGKILIYPETNITEKIEITSSSFCKFISGAKKILLMGITGGKQVMDFIEKEQTENMTKAVTLDAAAGEIVDSGLDYIISFYNKELIRKSEKLFSKRFSPGYGDLSIETQKIFYNLLEMEKIGVDITESFMLIPQKSIIALTGIV